MITPLPTVRFLDALSWTPGTYRAVFIKPKQHPPWLKWFTDRASLLQYLATGNASRYDCYVSVGLSSTKRGPKKRPDAEDIVLLPALWADIDLHGEAHQAPLPKTIEQAVALLPEAGLPEPSLLVATGHGLNPYWLLADPWVFETAAERHAAHRIIDGVQKALKAAALQHGWTLDTVSAINTTLRLVGSWNYHVKPRELVTLIGEAGTRYDRALFAPFAERSTLVIPSSPTLITFRTPNVIRGGERMIVEPEPLPLRRWTSEELRAVLTTPEMELYFARRLGVPVGFNVAHTCILHPDERNPSGNLTYDEENLGLYWCNHHEKRGLPDRTYTLPALFAYRETGVLERLKPGTTFSWRLRMAAEFGVLPLPEIAWEDFPPPPANASDQDMVRYGERLAAYESAKLRYALQALTGEEGVGLSRHYFARWAGLTRTHAPAHAEKLAEEHLHWILDMGLLVRVREYRSPKEPALYAPSVVLQEVELEEQNVISQNHQDCVSQAVAAPAQLLGSVG